MGDVRWHELELAATIARAGSALAAARELSLNQSTVSRRLAALEQRLGVTLFDRQAQCLVPTTAGAELVEAARAIEDRIHGVVRRISGHDQRVAGSVRLTGPRPLLGLIMPQLGVLTDAHPDLALIVDASLQVANLHRQEADIAIRLTGQPSETLVGRRIARIAYALYRRHDADPHDPRVVGFPAPRGDIATRPWLQKCVDEPRVRVRIAEDELHREAVTAGLGAAQLMCFVGDRDPSLRRVAQAPIEWGEPLWVLTHPALRHVARVRAVLDAVVQGLCAAAPLLQGEHPAEG